MVGSVRGVSVHVCMHTRVSTYACVHVHVLLSSHGAVWAGVVSKVTPGQSLAEGRGGSQGWCGHLQRARPWGQRDLCAAGGGGSPHSSTKKECIAQGPRIGSLDQGHKTKENAFKNGVCLCLEQEDALL